MSMRRRSAAGAVWFTPPTGIKSLDDLIARRRTAAIARIVKAVGNIPSDDARLATAIWQAYIETPADLGISERSHAKERLKAVRGVVKAADKLDVLIASDPFIRQRLNYVSTPFSLPPIKQLLVEAHALLAELASLAKEGRSKAAMTERSNDRRPSELEWLAGVRLPLIYERHFGRRSAGELFACRSCYGLVYESQQSPLFRNIRRAQKIGIRLGGIPDPSAPFPERPCGMHTRTYLRLRERTEAAEAIGFRRR
jgi:hypothetical protein